MELIQSANLALRFVLELGALVAFGYWGYQSTDGPIRFVAALGIPLLVAMVWGMLVAPNAAVDLPQLPRFVLGLLILGLAATAVGITGRSLLAGAFGGVVVVNAALMLAWQQ